MKFTELKNELRDALPVAAAWRQDGSSDDDNNDDTMPFADGDEEEALVQQNTQQEPTQVTYQTYCHGGWHWHVPKDFAFPTGVQLETGWKMWICGLLGNETINDNGNCQQAPIHPI